MLRRLAIGGARDSCCGASARYRLCAPTLDATRNARPEGDLTRQEALHRSGRRTSWRTRALFRQLGELMRRQLYGCGSHRPCGTTTSHRRAGAFHRGWLVSSTPVTATRGDCSPRTLLHPRFDARFLEWEAGDRALRARDSARNDGTSWRDLARGRRRRGCGLDGRQDPSAWSPRAVTFRVRGNRAGHSRYACESRRAYHD